MRRALRRRYPMVSDIFVDTVTMTATLSSLHASELLGKLDCHEECRRRRGRLYGYDDSFRIILDTLSNDVLLVQLSLRGDGTSFRCEFHPGHGNSFLAQQWLEELLPMGYLPFLLYEAYITRLDLTVDVSSRNVEELLIYIPRMQVNRLYAGKGGIEEIESQYVGNRRSARSFLMYDRKKCIQRRNRKRHLRLDVPTGRATRLEFRISQPGLSYRQIVNELANPFIGLEVYDLTIAPSFLTPPDRWFVDSCRLRGVNSALFDLHQRARRNRLDMLRSCYSPSWWRPDAWEDWHDCLNILAPHPDTLAGISDYDENEADRWVA